MDLSTGTETLLGSTQGRWSGQLSAARVRAQSPPRLALGLPQRRLLLQHHARKTLRGSAEDLCNAAIKQAVLAKCSFRTNLRVKSPTALDSGVQELVPRCNHCIARGLITSALKVLSNKLSAQQSAKLPAAGQPGQLAQPQWALEECPRATAGQQTAPEA